MSQQNSSKFREFLLLNLGILPVIIGVYFFKFPNNFSIGGVSGLSGRAQWKGFPSPT